MASGANAIMPWAGLGVDRLQVMNPGVFHTGRSLAQHVLATSPTSFHSRLLIPFHQATCGYFLYISTI